MSARAGTLSPGRAALRVYQHLEESGLVSGAPPRALADVVRECLVDMCGYPADAVAVATPRIVHALAQRIAGQPAVLQPFGEGVPFRLEDVATTDGVGRRLGVAATSHTRRPRAGDVGAPGVDAGQAARSADALVPTMLQLIRGLTPTGFEHAARRGLVALGCDDVRNVGGPGDGGVDLVGRLHLAVPVGARHLWSAAHADMLDVFCQAKRYRPSHPIGPGEVREFLSAMALRVSDEGGTRVWAAVVGVIVTSSGFTDGARRLAHRHRVITVTGLSLARLLADAATKEGVPLGAAALLAWLTAPVIPPPADPASERRALRRDSGDAAGPRSRTFA